MFIKTEIISGEQVSKSHSVQNCIKMAVHSLIFKITKYVLSRKLTTIIIGFRLFKKLYICLF